MGLADLERLNSQIVACRRCPRLVSYRERAALNPPKRFKGQTYWAKPLTGFGDINARLLIVGLAPAAHGGNRTGRMFTGDSSGNTLMSSLHKAGFANKPTSERCDDGLVLHDAYVTAVVRCPPPSNRPNASEISNCLSYLREEMRVLENVKVVVALGGLAFNSLVRIFREQAGVGDVSPAFRHGAVYRLRGRLYGRTLPVLIASYHPSRQNTQTGRLTQAMLDRVFLKASRIAGGRSY